MDTIEIGGPGMAVSSGPGAAEGRLNGRRRARAKDDHGDAVSCEPRDYPLMARQVAGAWMIALSIAGLGLALSINHVDLATAASAAGASRSEPVRSIPDGRREESRVGVL